MYMCVSIYNTTCCAQSKLFVTSGSELEFALLSKATTMLLLAISVSIYVCRY